MQSITPGSRQQYEFLSPDDFIDKDNPIRFTEVFIEKPELNKLGFKLNTIKSEGQPFFQTSLSPLHAGYSLTTTQQY